MGIVTVSISLPTSSPERLSAIIDARNYRFQAAMKRRIGSDLSRFSENALEWLVMEHYQFSFANKGLLEVGIASTMKLAHKGVSNELHRNLREEDGHAPMYKRGMLLVGTDMNKRAGFEPTSTFLRDLRELISSSPSKALGALYATETAAIFEHETFFDICREVCSRRGEAWEGSVIKYFHDIHLSGGVEQGHKDGLAIFVDCEENKGASSIGDPIDCSEVLFGAIRAIELMEIWWVSLLDRAELTG